MGNTLTNPPVSTLTSIDEKIKENCIVVYSTTVCGFCTKAKRLMDEMGLNYSVVEIDKLSPSEGGQVSRSLSEKTQMRTVSFLHFWTIVSEKTVTPYVGGGSFWKR